MEDINIEIHKDALEIGFANLIASLLRENLQNNEEKRRVFEKLKGEVLIIAKDADVSILLSFQRGKLTIYNGDSKQANFVIKSNSEKIIGLSNIKLFGGFPFLLNKIGIDIIKDILIKDIEIKGFMKNLLFGINLLKIISVN